MRVTPINNQQNPKMNLSNQTTSFKATISQAEVATELWGNGHDILLSMVSSKILNGIKEMLSLHKVTEPVEIKLGQLNSEKHKQAGAYIIDEFLNLPLDASLKEKIKKVSPDQNPLVPNTFGEFLKAVFTERNTPNPDVLTLESKI